jgi:hypothetical protein
MENFQRKYFFHFMECHYPVGFTADGGRLSGLIFERTTVESGQLIPVAHSHYTVNAPLVISAIGSLPEPIAGIPSADGIFDVTDIESGQLKDFPNVFVLGNAITGRGNIKESQMHGRQVSMKVLEEYLVWQEKDYQEIFKKAEGNSRAKVERIHQKLNRKKLLAAGQIQEIYNRIKNLQQQVGYNGDYDTWIRQHLPPRIEHSLHDIV